MTDAAREVLRHIDKVVPENAEPLGSLSLAQLMMYAVRSSRSPGAIMRLGIVGCAKPEAEGALRHALRICHAR